MDPLPSEHSSRPTGRLVLNQADFVSQSSSILLDTGSCAIGRVRRRFAGGVQEWVVDRWEANTLLPDGRQMAPMLDMAILGSPQPAIQSPRQLITSVRPKRSHLVIAMMLKPDHENQLRVLIFDEGRVFVPKEIRFIGGGMEVITAEGTDRLVNSANQILAPREIRTAGALGQATFAKVKSLSVALVGAGRGGSELVRQLASLGGRRFSVVDGDLLGPENLDAMPFASPRHVGQVKARIFGQQLRRNQPEIVYRYLPDSITMDRSRRVFHESRFDVVFSFVDCPAARLQTSILCQETESIHVDIGTLIPIAPSDKRMMLADIRVFIPGEGCVACVPEMDNLQNVLYEMGRPNRCLIRGRKRAWNADRRGSLLHLNALACSLAVEAWLGLIEQTDSNSRWIRVEWPAGEIPQIRSLPVTKGEGCRFCESK